MKTCLAFLLVLFSLKSYSQHPAAFVGTWKVHVFKSADVDFYFEKDSTVVHESTKHKIKEGIYNSTTMEMFLEITKTMGRTLSFTFYADGRYEQSFSAMGDMAKESGTYYIDEANNKIHFTKKDRDGKISQTSDSFKWNGKFLSLVISDDQEPSFFELKKVD